MITFERVVEYRMSQIDIINNHAEQHERLKARARIEGMEYALQLYGWDNADLGRVIVACDQVQIDRGEDRAMCGGEFI